MRIQRHRLWLFPLVAGTVWFITVSTLLLVWIARGMPKYPEQSNPYVAFISDIGAFQMKPVFLVGGIATGISYCGTVASVHFARYDSAMYAINDVRWKKILSVAAAIFGVISSISLVLLVFLDTYRYHGAHTVMLLTVFLSLAVSAVMTLIVYSDQMGKSSPFPRLRRHVLISLALVLFEACLAIPFFTFIWLGPLRAAGTLEWVITNIGAVYLLNFVGYVVIPGKDTDDEATRPLLRGDS